MVLEASYGPTDPDPEARALIVDVTVPIQALVHKSQLYIPGHRSKVCTPSLMMGVFHAIRRQSGLQGFYDPVPSCAKCLRIRYTFGSRMHYCEIPDYKSVVLPLGGKQTGGHLFMSVLITDSKKNNFPFLSLVVGATGNLDHLVERVW